MTADIQAARDRLTNFVEALKKNPYDMRRARGPDVRILLAELSRLEGENKRLREAIGLSSVDIFSDLMDLYADPHIDRLTYAAAKAIVAAEESATRAETALAEARRQIAERVEALKLLVDASASLIVKAIRAPEDEAGLEDWTAAITKARALLSKPSEQPATQEEEKPVVHCMACGEPGHRLCQDPALGAKAALAFCAVCNGVGAVQVGSPEAWTWEACEACGGSGNETASPSSSEGGAQDA